MNSFGTRHRLKAMYVIHLAEADESNGSISSEEDLGHLDYSKTFSVKQTVPKKSISQIIKDKKKQTQLTLQWYSLIIFSFNEACHYKLSTKSGSKKLYYYKLGFCLFY